MPTISKKETVEGGVIQMSTPLWMLVFGLICFVAIVTVAYFQEMQVKRMSRFVITVSAVSLLIAIALSFYDCFRK